MNAVKWIATAFIVLATLARALEYHHVDLVFGSVGTFLWIYIAHKMKEGALLAVNTFCLMILIFGLLK